MRFSPFRQNQKKQHHPQLCSSTTILSSLTGASLRYGTSLPKNDPEAWGEESNSQSNLTLPSLPDEDFRDPMKMLSLQPEYGGEKESISQFLLGHMSCA